MKFDEILKINGHHYIKITDEHVNRIKSGELKLKIVYEENIPNLIDVYWERAAKDFKCEIFMNTVRPLLKETLGNNYSELKCEEKAKLLCQKYYEFEDKGEKYAGPYLL